MRDTTTGLKFEKATDLIDYLVRGRGYKHLGENIYSNGRTTLVNLKGNKLYTWLNSYGVKFQDRISRKLLPDECVYSTGSNTLYVFEKKFQQTAGSADEKLQTCDFKKKQYEKLVKGLHVKVEYTYLLSDWFKNPMYKDVLEYIEASSVSPINSNNMKTNVFMTISAIVIYGFFLYIIISSHIIYVGIIIFY